MVDGIPPALHFLAAEHQDVLRDEEMGKGVVQPIHFDEPTPFRSERFPFDDDQVDIRVRSRFAPGVRTEEDDLVRIDIVHDRSHHLLEQRRVDRHGPSAVRFRRGGRSAIGRIVGQHTSRAARPSGGLRFGPSRNALSVGSRRGRGRGGRTAHGAREGSARDRGAWSDSGRLGGGRRLPGGTAAVASRWRACAGAFESPASGCSLLRDSNRPSRFAGVSPTPDRGAGRFPTHGPRPPHRPGSTGFENLFDAPVGGLGLRPARVGGCGPLSLVFCDGRGH